MLKVTNLPVVSGFIEWCKSSVLTVNVTKTKEVIIKNKQPVQVVDSEKCLVTMPTSPRCAAKL